MNNIFITTQLIVAVIIGFLFGVWWGLFSIVLTELLLAVSFNRDSKYACYYGLILTIISWQPIFGVLGACYYLLIEAANDIYLKIKYRKY